MICHFDFCTLHFELFMLIGIDAHNLEGNRTGVGRYLFNLLQEWSKLSSKFKVQNSKFILYFKDEIPADVPRSALFEMKLFKVGSTAKFMHWNLWRAAKKDKVDILFCPGYVAPIFWQDKLALTLHDIIYEAHPDWFEFKNPADKILLKWVSKRSAKKASVIFVPSEFSRNEVIKYYKVKSEKITVTYEAGEINAAETIGSQDLIKGRLNLKKQFAFFVGSIFNRRHMSEIISAFGRLAKERPDLQLLIAGKDRTKPEQHIDKLVSLLNEKLGRQAILRVDFVGDNDLKLLYQACAFFIWLSDYEGFGLPPLEAMALGAPVITSDSTSLKEVAGSAALLIKNNSDVNEIYQAMRRLVEDENLRQELIRHGKEQAAKFSWEKCAEETLNGLIRIKS